MAVKVDLVKQTVTLGVGDLVAEPLTGAGRVAGLSLWTRLALGREAHTQHQRSQTWAQTGYQREITIRHTMTVAGFQVHIQGRMDGVYLPREGDSAHGTLVIEEIKSVVLAPLAFAALTVETFGHYVEQLRMYCFFAERGDGAAETGPATAVTGRLVFLNVADGTRKELEIGGPFDDCGKLIADRVRVLIDQVNEKCRSQTHRRALAASLTFPHRQPRRHQDEMMAAVDAALAAGRHLLVSAPSGIGKTAGALYPVVKYALAHDQRVFFVTAKNTQQQIVRETLERMNGVRAVTFRAREQMCINQVYACREEFCSHLQMFRAKLERTRVLDRLLEKGPVSPEALIEAGRGAGLCPFELALLAAERVDVVVCDYNYVFDPQVYLRRFFQDADYSDAILVIDEAHNLLQRAMDYYSPVLRRQQIREVREQLHHTEPALARDLTRFLTKLDAYFRVNTRPQADEYSQLDEAEGSAADQFLVEPPRAFFEELKPAFHKLAMRYMLDKVTSGRAIPDDAVEQFFADFGQFCSVLALEGEEFSHIFDTTAGRSLKILCKDPSAQLARRLDGFHSVIAMSATLEPVEFYSQMLGFDPERTGRAVFPSPFPRQNRRILVVPTVSTTYQHRPANYGRIAQIIVETITAHRGNYMALFPSYQFLQAVADRLVVSDWQLVVQEPKMTEQQRQTLLATLVLAGPPKLVLAVQGGLFAEGVDYAGGLLSGVIVVSPALPQVSFERDIMQQYYEDRYGQGFDYAYLYPGMNRVIQSVGRLIRSETDRGVAVLVCQRFAKSRYMSLFPRDWTGVDGKGLICKDLSTELRKFWAETDRPATEN